MGWPDLVSTLALFALCLGLTWDSGIRCMVYGCVVSRFTSLLTELTMVWVQLRFLDFWLYAVWALPRPRI